MIFSGILIENTLVPSIYAVHKMFCPFDKHASIFFLTAIDSYQVIS